jgi:phospholipase C
MGCNSSTVRHAHKADVAYQKKYGKPRPAIEHVVVLMLENRTFDNLLGVFMERRMQKGEVKPSRWDVHAQAGKTLYQHCNKVVPRGKGENDAVEFPVWSCDPEKEDIHSKAALRVPNGDPAEKYEMLNLCMFGKGDPKKEDPMTFEGFAQQYYEREMHDKEELGEEWAGKTDFEARRSPAMHVYLPEQLPVVTELAETFGVSDTYFASAPCQTWPNRLFATAGHCYGYVNNLVDTGKLYDHDKIDKEGTLKRVLQFEDESLFNKLLHHGINWGIYAGDFPLVSAHNLRLNEDPRCLTRLYGYDDFLEHAKAGDLPQFSWVEPQYLVSSEGDLPTDMHPPHSVNPGQKLIAEMYNALRTNDEAWSKTLFIINCDEGVGVFDHVPPPAAKPPKAHYKHTFYGQGHPSEAFARDPFSRYGTRTLCLLVSPFLDAGAVVRPDEKYSEYPFDHTSVIRTVFDLFVSPDCHLQDRDKIAPSLCPYLRESARTDLGPKTIKVPEVQKAEATEIGKALDGLDDLKEGKTHPVKFLSSCLKEGSLHKGLTEAYNFVANPVNKGRKVVNDIKN